jgi:hypothetical protein
VALSAPRGTIEGWRQYVRNALLFFALAGVVVSAASFAGGCSSEDPKDARVNLPPRDPNTDSGTAPPVDSGTTPPLDCTKSASKVSETPACDTCAKQKCCAEIQACVASNDCLALQKCIEPCDQSDTFCIYECTLKHGKGAEKLQEVGSCAGLKCKAECPEPDAGDPFADSGL